MEKMINKNLTFVAIGLIVIGLLGMMYYKFDFSKSGGSSVSVDKMWTFGQNELDRLDVFSQSTDIKVEFIRSRSDQSPYVQVKGNAYKDIADKIEKAMIHDKTLSLDISTKEWQLFTFDFTNRTLHIIV